MVKILKHFGTKYIALTILLFMQTSLLFAQGTLSGRVLDNKKEPLIDAAVMITNHDTLIGGNITDFDGYFTIKPVTPGTYDVIVVYTGFDSLVTTGVVINSDTKILDFILTPSKGHRFICTIRIACPPMFDVYNPTKRIYTREDIEHMPH